MKRLKFGDKKTLRINVVKKNKKSAYGGEITFHPNLKTLLYVIASALLSEVH